MPAYSARTSYLFRTMRAPMRYLAAALIATADFRELSDVGRISSLAGRRYDTRGACAR